MAAGDDVLERKKAWRDTPPVEVTDCPRCEWPLEDSPRGKHCPFCGLTQYLSIKVHKE